MAKFDPPPPLNPLIDRHQYLRRWLRCGHLPPCKISSRSDDGIEGFRFCACATSRTEMLTRLFFFVSSNRLQPRRPHRFWYKIRQKTRFRARMCLLGVAKPKFKLQTPFYLPRKLVRTKLVRNRVHFGRDLRNFARKTALTLDMLACKRSLVVIVAP